MIDTRRAGHVKCVQLDEFGDKYTPVKPSPRSMPSADPSPPTVSSHPLPCVCAYVCALRTLNCRFFPHVSGTSYNSPMKERLVLSLWDGEMGSEQFCNFPKVAVLVNSESVTKTQAHLTVRLSPADLDCVEHGCLSPGAVGYVNSPARTGPSG